MLFDWLEFAKSIEVMSKVCDDNFTYEISKERECIHIIINEDDDAIFTDYFELLIFNTSMVFIYNSHYNIFKYDDIESGKKYIIDTISKIRQVLKLSDFDDRLKIFNGE
jgi:hypothetical protein